MFLFLIACFLLIFSTDLLNATDLSNTYFVNPPADGSDVFYAEDNLYQIGVLTTVKWETDMTTYSVFLWAQSENTIAATSDNTLLYKKSQEDPEEGSFVWNVSTDGFDTNIYFLTLGPEGSGGTANLSSSATSHYFNVTSATVAIEIPLTTSATTINSSIAQTTTTPTVTAGTSSKVATTSASSSPTCTPHTLKSSSSLGIGLGLGLGVPILLLVASFSALKLYQYRKQKSPTRPSSTAKGPPGSGVPQAKYRDFTGYETAISRSELPTTYNLAGEMRRIPTELDAAGKVGRLE